MNRLRHFLLVNVVLISCYKNKSYHIAPLDFGEGGAIVLLSACFLALSRTRWGLGMVPPVTFRRSENENYSRKSSCVATT